MQVIRDWADAIAIVGALFVAGAIYMLMKAAPVRTIRNRRTVARGLPAPAPASRWSAGWIDWMRGGVVLAFVCLPGLVSAQTPTPSPMTIRIDTFVGALVTSAQDRTPMVGLRGTIDTRGPLGLHLVARADLLALQDGGAIDANLTKVPNFTSGEFFVAAYKPMVAALSIECAFGRAVSLERNADVQRTDPQIWACGAGLHAGDMRAFLGLGQHEATGKGQRWLYSLSYPLKGKSALQVDGAAWGKERMARVGLAVRF